MKLNAADHQTNSTLPGLLTLFEQQVQQHPDAIAVVHRQRNLSYAELDARSSRLAYWLSEYLPATESTPLIPFCLTRSPEQIIVLLAILKVGGAYVPIDHCAPPSRNQMILEDIAAQVMITDNSTHQDMAALCQQGSNTMFLLNIEQEQGKMKSALEKKQTIYPEPALAYVMYTSGSTGKPKGALIPRAGIVRLVHQSNYVEIRPDDALLQAASISFDAATFEIWGALLNGARTVLVDTDVVVDSQSLRQRLVEESISILFMTTGLFNQHIAANPGIFSGLRYVMFGGEAASVETVRRLWSYGERPQYLYNVYGPTENTTFSTWFPIEQEPPAGQAIPIGQAISHSSCFVVDDNFKQVPAGHCGELLVGGSGLAFAYLNRPKLSAEKFITSPFDFSQSLYRTGDLVELAKDGNIVFSGRVDNQVKIRGFRVEPEEIELVLEQHPSIDDVAVVTENDVTGTQRLVAYLRIRIDATIPNASALRAYIEQNLPPYMVPASFRLTKDAFPLGMTGKVDRQALPYMDCETLLSDIERVAPRNQLEGELCAIWEQHLRSGSNTVGVHCNFFTLGGQSLLAAAIVQDISAHYGIVLKLAEFLSQPTVAELAVFVESAEQASQFSIPAAHQDHDLPLSWSQEQIWLHQQIEPQAVYYNEPLDITIPEDLDEQQFSRAIRYVLQRHEALRLQISSKKGQPLQHLATLENFRLSSIDFRHLPLKRRTSEAIRMATQMAKQPFDLAHELPLRFMLVRLEDERYRLFMIGHHIALDGVGMFQVFLPELELVYRAYCQNSEPSLPALAYSWSDWLLWQRAQGIPPLWQRQLAYWREQLAEIQPLDFSADHIRHGSESFAGRRITLEIASHQSQRLKDMAKAQQSTLFALLLSAFQALLYRHTQQTDIAIGSVVSGRSIPGLSAHACDALNSVILRSRFQKDGSFLDLLTQTRQTCQQAFANQDVPFQLVTRQLTPDGSRGRSVPIQVAFVFQPGLPANLSGWEMNQLDVHTDTAKFDLTVELDERDGKIIGRIEYRTDVFEQSGVQRLIGHYQTLLEGILNNPAMPLYALPLMNKEERERVLYAWNESDVHYHPPTTLHALLEQRAQQTPDAPAILTSDRCVSFAELIACSGAIAQQLQQRGIGLGQRVAVWTDRGAEHFFALLGVLRAGAAYVPLGVDDPTQRVTRIIKDAAAAVVLLDNNHTGLLDDSIQQWCIEGVSAPDEQWCAPTIPSDALAYIIYTSGSTGQPKGVMIEHAAIVERCMWAAADMRLAEGHRMLHLLSLAFDASIQSSWWVMAAGAAMVMPANDEINDSTALLKLTQKHAVTHICATPSLWGVLLDPIEQHNIHLAWAGTGGERLSAELLQRLRIIAERVVNHYGPTETSVVASCWEDDGRSTQQPPIGGPLANVKLYVLDPHLQPVPVGLRGELYIGGKGVARGYLNMPERSDASFIDNPFSEGRMYRTGDIVRWLESGELEYLGRLDHQVKIRGFRIELGEIEAAILALPDVEDVAVVVQKELENQRLVAYVVGDQRVDLASLLKTQLPDAMNPSAIMFLDELPLTANGKVNLLALPKPVKYTRNQDEEPSDSFERVLIEHFRAIIGQDVSPTDDFFECGGDSLSAMQLVAHIVADGIEMTIRDLFHQRTPRSLANALRISQAAQHFTRNAPEFHGGFASKDIDPVHDIQLEQQQLRAESPLLVLREQGDYSPLFFMHPAGGSAVCYQQLAEYLPNQPFYGLDCVDGYQGKTLVSMAAEYLQYIRQIQPHGPYYLGGWSFGGNLAAEMAYQLEQSGEQVPLVVMIDSRPVNHPLLIKFLTTMNQDSAAIHCLIGRHFAQITDQPEPVSYQQLLQVPDEQRRSYFLGAVEKSGMFPLALADNFVQRFVDDFQESNRIMVGYQLEDKINADILLLRATDVSHHYEGFPAMEEPLSETVDPSYGWTTCTQGRVTVFSTPGSHETCVFAPHVSKAAMHIRSELSRSQGRQTGYYNALPSLTVEQWERALAHMTHSVIPAGKLLIEEGQDDRKVFLVASGLLEIQSGEFRAEVGTGTVLGEVSFIDGKPRTASIVALSESSVYGLSPESFQKLERDESEVAAAILFDLARVVSKRFRGYQ